MPLGTEVGLGLDDTVLDGDQAPPQKGAQHPPHFSDNVYCGPNGRPSQQLLSCCYRGLNEAVYRIAYVVQ